MKTNSEAFMIATVKSAPSWQAVAGIQVAFEHNFIGPGHLSLTVQNFEFFFTLNFRLNVILGEQYIKT